MEEKRRLSAIGRTIDPSYPTNRLIAAITILYTIGGVIFLWVSGAAVFEGAYRGAAAGLAVFLAWALGRELDPDHDAAAFVGAGLAAGTVPFLNPPALSALLWLLVLMRIVNRTTGLPATLMDSFFLIGLSVWMIIRGNWIAGVMTAAALVCDGVLPPKRQRQWRLAVIPLLGAVWVLIREPVLFRISHNPILPIGFVFLTALSFIPVVIGARSLRSRGDLTGEILQPSRVIAAQILALSSVIPAAVFFGFPGIEMFMPFWAAVLGSALFVLIRTIFRSFRNSE